ncbi:myosin-2-like isoform X2 [Andrographis paniculata]|uniref:myosin-2-like isoform X2 n=1 Tax=Andrographis paniculata TaxID=175694 RepID=UPI0021E6F507|nr:myosin-2-like isoform X2 [Andrographis paniculata]
MLSMTMPPTPVVRSSLEEMLESLRRSDETEKPGDMPPALPARPKPTPRARLPSAKRPLPTSLEAGESTAGRSLLKCDETKEKPKGMRARGLVVKKLKETKKSPYVGSDEEDGDQRSEVRGNGEVENCASRSPLRSRDSEWDDIVGYFIKEKLPVWCQLHDDLWRSGHIQSTSGEKASVLLSDGSVVTVPAQELLPTNPSILDGVDDLVQLSYVNEPSVIHNIQYRYSQEMPYTKAGPVLVSVNPLKDIYLDKKGFVAAYRHKSVDMPNVYAIANAAYNEMMTDNTNQSIIVSGVSGSGKTEIAKIALLCLTAFSGVSDAIESEILQMSCILEAFGNAKTARNDNSSRFGKLIEVYFSGTGHICGAKVQTLLLEKSRVVQLAQGERSYHIFYQLCSGAPSDLRGRLRLKKASDYNYLNQSDCMKIHNIDDAQKFHTLVEALYTLRIGKEDQEHVFEMVAAILWLGNISFLVTDNQNHVEVVADEALSNAASLIGCSENELMLALSTRKIQAGKDKVTRRLTQQQAIEARDALAKFIYANLFDWLLQEINSSLANRKHDTGRSITILDIYGFESREKNSFEQFCINYANERLRQHFNRHLFKLKQEEYELDGVESTKVDFEDNQNIVDLFEKKPDGLISLLDEVSTSPKATDLTFASKLKQCLNGNNCFKVERGGTFTIRHCGGEVLYEMGKFLEKNRDSLPFETIQLLQSCAGRIPQHFASSLLKQSQNPENMLMQPGMLAFQNQNVATKFKGQLFKLMQHLENTKPHFICCIKPNRNQIPGVFEKDHVLQQLRCCQVLEVVRFSRFGYPTSMTHQEFRKRYGFLLPEHMASQDPLSMSIAVLQQFGILPETYQVGYTRLYFRAGQIVGLEDVRKKALQTAQEMQKIFPGNPTCHESHEFNGAAITLQSYVRGENTRKEYGILEKHSAIVHIQSVIRGWLARRHFSHNCKPNKANSTQAKPYGSVSEVKDLPPKSLPSVVEDLKRQMLMAQAELEHKEKENADLREQMKQYSVKWSEYENRMKSMEEMWQKQMVSLQMNLANTKKNMGTENKIGRIDGGVQSPQYYDSEDMSMGTQTPGGCTPARLFSNGVEDLPIRDANGVSNPVGNLLREFEQTRQNFDEQAVTIVETKTGQSLGANPVDELRRLKHRFEAWKKDYKIRLKEAKARVHRTGQAETEKHRRKWWGKKK